MLKVKVGSKSLDFEMTSEESLLELLLRNDVEIFHSCGGMGICGTCRVYVESSVGELPQRNEIESEMAEDRGFSESERLSCQLSPHPGLCIRIPES